jgi:hypothetical protein
MTRCSRWSDAGRRRRRPQVKFRSDLRTLEDRILRALALTYGDKATDLFIGFMPAGVTSYKLGDRRPGASAHRRQTLFNFHNVRVSAVGPGVSSPRSRVRPATPRFSSVDQTYLIYPLGAVVVAPSHPELPAPGLRGTTSAGGIRPSSSARVPADWAARHPHSRWFTIDELTAAPGR